MAGLTSEGKTTILISCDGFRWDYNEWYDTPFLDAMASAGAKGELVPSFPSKTFPNHYTLATGLRPEHHGIIANSFIDRKRDKRFALSDPETKFDAYYYKGEPIWITARRQGKRTAVFYWPGSDVAVGGQYPDLWHSYDEKPHLTFEQRIDGILGQLKAKPSPDLIMAYFEEPDASGHLYGPQARQTQAAVEHIDSLLGHMWGRICKEGLSDSVNLVIVSDHGMTWYMPSRQIAITPNLQPSWYERVEGNLPANIYAPERWQQDSIVKALSHIPHLRAWRKEDIPAWLHYQADANIGDVVALPDEGYLFADGKSNKGGVHGYDPDYSDMHALFRAYGPDIKQGVDLGQFSNTAVYAIVCRLLRIKPAPYDGTDEYQHIAPQLFGPSRPESSGDLLMFRPLRYPYEPWETVEEMPQFPGNEGAKEYFRQFIARHTQGKTGVQRLTMSFIVEKDGTTSGLTFSQNNHSLSEEAKTAVKQAFEQMPRWRTGKQNGHSVRVKEQLTVNIGRQ